jgi:ribosomal protein L11 methyltransferase
MSQDWIEVIIETSADAAELLGMLDDPDVTGGWQDNRTVRLYWPPGRWSPEIRRRLEAVVNEPLAVRPLPSEDWNARWKENIRSVRVGRRILIRPSWEPAKLRPGDVELVIDPKEAFGTGHHATTQLLLEWLEDLYDSGRGATRILDLGTGSGILAMAAVRLGACAAVGIDNDPNAISAARGYADINRFGPELEFRVASLETVNAVGREPYDLIIANLDRRTILGSMDVFARWLRYEVPLLISGLLIEDRDDVAHAFGQISAAVRTSTQRDGWLALQIGLGEADRLTS